jgi:competence protein ComEA
MLILGFILIFIQVHSVDVKNRLILAEINNTQALTPQEIPEKTEKAASGEDNNANKVNVNAATVQQLDQLPGIGKTTAERIIEHRKSLGGFKSISDLSTLKGMTPKKLAELSRLLSFSGDSTTPGSPRKLNLNFATEKEIQTLPGVGARLARSIVDTRAKLGSFRSLEDLEEVPGLTEKTFRKFEELVEVR